MNCGAELQWRGSWASALALGDDEVVFAVWDQRLRRGVRAAGLRLAPVVDG